MVVDNFAKDRAKFNEDLKHHINQPHVKAIIEKKLDKSGNLNKNNQGLEGQILHASLSNYQHNLVKGPNRTDRANDPGPGRDTEIIRQQPKAFQDAVKQFDAKKDLRSFTDLPKPDPGTWKKGQNGNYTFSGQQVIFLSFIFTNQYCAHNFFIF